MCKIKTLIIVLSGLFLPFSYLSFSAYTGYKQSDLGFYYKFHKRTGNERANTGDEIMFKFRYSLKDSLLYEVFSNPVKEKIQKSLYRGDIFDCLRMMSAGDSASFIIQADSFYLKTIGKSSVPDFVKPDTKLFFDIELVSIKTKEDFFIEEEKAIKEYKVNNEISKRFLDTDIFYKTLENGKGNYPDSSDMITVDYTVKTLTGKIIGGSDTEKRKGPLTIECLSINPECKGFNLIISKMKKGEKGEYLLPSSYAFGEVGVTGHVKSFTPLVYIIEIIGFKPKHNFDSKENN